MHWLSGSGWFGSFDLGLFVVGLVVSGGFVVSDLGGLVGGWVEVCVLCLQSLGWENPVQLPEHRFGLD